MLPVTLPKKWLPIAKQNLPSQFEPLPDVLAVSVPPVPAVSLVGALAVTIAELSFCFFLDLAKRFCWAR